MLLDRSPMQVFATMIIFGLIMLVISPVVILSGVAGNGWRSLNRLLSGIVMLLVSIGIFINIMVAYTGGKHMVVGQVESKWVQSCGKNSTCYDVMLQSGERFRLPKDVYMQMQPRACYRITYYHGMFGTTDDFVASIGQLQPGHCKA